MLGSGSIIFGSRRVHRKARHEVPLQRPHGEGAQEDAELPLLTSPGSVSTRKDTHLMGTRKPQGQCCVQVLLTDSAQGLLGH